MAVVVVCDAVCVRENVYAATKTGVGVEGRHPQKQSRTVLFVVVQSV